jgi:RNA polymerase sigma factor (TIGR02999 family)
MPLSFVRTGKVCHVSRQEITQILDAVAQNEDGASEYLWKLVYGELRAIAAAQMAREAPGRTLQPTALVHEAYFRLFGKNGTAYNNRAHFFASAARVMRHIRVDDARKRNRVKRGGGNKPGELLEEPAVFDQDPLEVIEIHEILDRLEKVDQLKAQLVMLRYFAGLNTDECAAALGVSRRTVTNQWQLARAWLYRELSGHEDSLGELE